jgi:hypothetical protein
VEHTRLQQGSRALVLDGSILVVRFLSRFTISDAFLVFCAIDVEFGQVTGRADLSIFSEEAQLSNCYLRARTSASALRRDLLHRNDTCTAGVPIERETRAAIARAQCIAMRC